MRRCCQRLTTAGLLAYALAAGAGGDYAPARQGMLEEIRRTVVETREATGREALSPRVMGALATVPRHEFVPPELRERAYENRPLPIGHGQTISQPYIVALMSDLLEAEAGDVVLEIGTGSGYQAAVLAEMGVRVYSVEIVPPLAESAKRRLARLGYEGVALRLGDGYHGWREHAPYDAIIVTAAPVQVPPPLVGQLRPGGRMVIPVGPRFGVQRLLLIEKAPDGTVSTRQVLPVRFVPLTGQH